MTSIQTKHRHRRKVHAQETSTKERTDLEIDHKRTTKVDSPQILLYDRSKKRGGVILFARGGKSRVQKEENSRIDETCSEKNRERGKFACENPG